MFSKKTTGGIENESNWDRAAILSTFQNKIAIFVLRHFAASKKRG